MSGAQKAEVREAAVLEQGGLCAYCMRRITALLRSDGRPDCNIEHWQARSAEGAHFDWDNLTAVCRGDLGMKPHCDKARGATTLSLHPKYPPSNVEALVTFAADGRARCVKHPSDIVTLNLNHAVLVRNRRQIVDAVSIGLRGADLTRLRLMQSRWSSVDPRPEFAGVVLPLIRRLIRRREAWSVRTRANR